MIRPKTFLLLLCLIIFSLALPPGNSCASPTDFKDLTVSSPVYPYIKFLTEKDLIKGYPDGNFMPEGQITRAEAAALLVKAAGLSPGSPPSAAYIDVRPDHWAYGIIESAAAAGIISGYPDGLFRPEAPVSRAEVAVLLLKLTSEPLPSVELPQYVTDVGPAHWAGQSIAASLRAGLLTGTEGHSFLPDLPATRAEVARGLAMMINLAPEHRSVPLTGILSPIEGEVFVKSSLDYTRVNDKAQCTEGVTVKTGPGGRAEIRFPDGSGLLLEENTLLTIKEARGQSTILRDGSPGAVIDYLELELPQGRIIGGLAAGYIYGQEQSGPEESGLPAARAALPGGKLLASTSLLPPGVWPSLAVEDTGKLPWWEEGYDKHVRVQVDMPWGVAGIRGTFWMNVVNSRQQSTSVIDGTAQLTSNGVTVAVTSGQESIINSPSSPPSQPVLMTLEQQRIWQLVSEWVKERARAIQNAAPVIPHGFDLNIDLPPVPDLSSLLDSLPQTTPGVSNTNQSGGHGNNTVSLGSIGSLTMSVGQQVSVTTAVSPSDAVLTAISSDTGIAVVSVTDKTIYVDGVANGTANITVTASKSGYDTAEVTFPVTVNNAGQVSSPTASPPAGTYSDTQSVSLSTLTDGADIWYTTDGSDPKTSGTRQQFSAAITVGETKTVKAYAVKEGLADSDVVSFNYVINVDAGQVSSPTASPPAGTYSDTQSVSLSTLTDGADIWYTTDGSDPTTSGTRQQFSAAITVGETKTVKAYAVKEGLADSDVVSFNYVIDIAVISPANSLRLSAVERVNLSSEEAQTTSGGYSKEPSVSAGGRYVAFSSSADNLVDGDTNATDEIFVRDRDAGTTVRVNVTSGGLQANSGMSDMPRITPDGRFVAFRSAASNLVSGDTNNDFDIFVHDRDVSNDGTFDQAGDIKTVRVSVDSAGAEVDGISSYPSISDDGRLVCFSSWTTSLVPGDTNGKIDIFVHNRDVNNDGAYDQPGDIDTARVSVSSSGDQADLDCYNPSISGNGQYVVYSSNSDTLVSGITDSGVFIRDLIQGTTDWAGAAGSMEPSISTDGRFIALRAYDTAGLVAGDSNSASDVFVLDRDPDEDGVFGPGVFERVSLSSDGQQPNSSCSGASISPEGRFVTFNSSAGNLVEEDINGVDDIFIHDRESGNTKRVSVSIDGWQGNGESGGLASVTSDGSYVYVAYDSDADNLVTGDSNLETDIFMSRLEVDPEPDITPPSVPGDFVVEITGMDWARLTWTPATDDIRVTRYEIYRGSSIDGSFNKIAGVSGAELIYWDNTLSPDTMYYYYVIAMDEDGNSSSQSSKESCSTTSPVGVSPALVPVAGWYTHSLMCKDDGTVWVWGDNGYGQIGDGTIVDRLTPVQVKGVGGTGNLDNVAALDAGRYHSVALKKDGTVWAWGRNNSGQLGNGTTTNSYTPVQVKGPGGIGFLTGVVSIASGYQHVAALRNDGTVWTWGSNNSGELGNGTEDQSSFPVPVLAPDGTGYLTGVIAIAAGNEHILALQEDGKVWSWGANGLGELGIGAGVDYNSHPYPVQVMGLSDYKITAIAAGEFLSMALSSDEGGKVWTWGDNGVGPSGGLGGLGDGTLAYYRSSPVQVVGEGGVGFLTGVSAISAGKWHTVALKGDGTVLTWGENEYGDLGIGSYDYNPHPTPVQVPGLSGITGIYAGYQHAFASNNAGDVWGWGTNSSGQLGDGTTSTRVVSPTLLHSLDGAANSAPVASNVQITGTAAEGQTLTGSYTYSDAEGDPEGASTYKWYADGVVIPGATSENYTLLAGDAGKTIQFQVTPVAAAGTTPGTPVKSASTSPVAAALSIIMASVTPGGIGGNGESLFPSISSDGRYVAFYSDAADLVAGDANSTDDIFVRDLQNDTTERISLSPVGTDSNSNSYLPSLSPDGRYVAFISAADNLVAGDSNGKWDVFVRDRQMGTTGRVSVPDFVYQGTLGSEANNDSYASYFTMFWPSVSSGGQYVAFTSQASNLVLGDTNNRTDIFVHDRLSGETVRASVYGSGTDGNDWSMKPSISADGRYVAFISNASNLVAGDTNSNPDVFVRDLLLGETVRVSVAGDGTQGNYFSGAIFYPSHEGNVSISADGRYVVFDSLADNLAPGDTNGYTDIFVHDRDTDEDGIYDEPGAVSTAMVSVSSGGDQSDSYSEKPSISPSGRYLAFVSQATNLAAGATTSIDRIYIRDLQLNTTERASAYTGRWPCVSNDGRVAFYSASTNLLPEDTNVYNDVFVRLP